MEMLTSDDASLSEVAFLCNDRKMFEVGVDNSTVPSRNLQVDRINITQTCAPHENAFSILRINFHILQSFSVVFF